MKLQPLADPHPAAAGTPLRYFIADLHLDGLDTPRSRNFGYFLGKLCDAVRSGPVELYIVGDLFEFWYEYRAALFDIYKRDLAALETASRAGVKIFLFYGNRDFLYGDYVRRRLGAVVLGDGEEVTLNDSRRVWLEHGDLLCTGDTRYLKFRAWIRSWPVRWLFWLLPWSVARKTIQRVRERSVADKGRKLAAAFKVDLGAARARLEAQRCQLLICGHTHTHQTEDLGAGLRLIVLPPWCEQPAGYVDDGVQLKTFEVSPAAE